MVSIANAEPERDGNARQQRRVLQPLEQQLTLLSVLPFWFRLCRIRESVPWCSAGSANRPQVARSEVLPQHTTGAPFRKELELEQYTCSLGDVFAFPLVRESRLSLLRHPFCGCLLEVSLCPAQTCCVTPVRWSAPRSPSWYGCCLTRYSAINSLFPHSSSQSYSPPGTEAPRPRWYR